MAFSALHNRRGAAAVEFGIVLPILVLLLFGIIEFSLLLYDKAVITNASREGARFGVVFRDTGAPITCDQITAKIDEYIASNLVTFGVPMAATKQYAPANCQPATGDNLTVSVNYQYAYLVLPNFVPPLSAGVNLGAQTVMVKE